MLVSSEFISQLAKAIHEAQKHNPWPTPAEKQAADIMRKTIATNIAFVLAARMNGGIDADRFLRECGIVLA